MKTLEERAIEFFIQQEVLTFGDFTLKSGRKSPYFFNTGKLCSGKQLAELGSLFAEKFLAEHQFGSASIIFGSAYKGIPISVATATALAGTAFENVRSVSDRKEAKTHGDTSSFLGVIGAGDKAVIVDDVITTGGTKYEAIQKLREVGCEPLGFIIAFDRAEPGEGTTVTAKEAFEADTKLPVFALANVNDVVKVKPEFKEMLEKYLSQFQ
ncbi:MAG: orotate phosphoribosyltransferase [bacterium]